MRLRFFLSLILVGIIVPVAAPAADLVEQTWMVDGLRRTALVHRPAGSAVGARPVVFVFHGHGGTAAQAARSFALHEQWPGAIILYPQGLPTPGHLTDREGQRTGWQQTAGDQGDRDLKFFDAMLADATRGMGGDARRVTSTGHSNGGAFTYLLWAERGEKLAAVAPSAALLARGADRLTPKPVLHLASPDDRLVKFAWQARMIDRVLALNGCPPRDAAATGLREYPSSRGAPVAVYLHEGGHRFPPEAAGLIVEFLRRHSLP